MSNTAKLVTTAASLATGFIAPKVVEKTWVLATGQEPPESDESGTLGKAVVYAALSAVAVVIIQRSVMSVVKRMVGDPDLAKKSA